MAPRYYVIPCTNPDCKQDSWIPVSTMQEIAQQRPQPAKGRFLNFVCPHCGFGTKHPLEPLQIRESRPVMRLGKEPLFGVTVRCGDEKCGMTVVAYTKCGSDGSGAEPTIAPQYWRSATLECPTGHRAKQPIEVLGSRIVPVQES